MYRYMYIHTPYVCIKYLAYMACICNWVGIFVFGIYLAITGGVEVAVVCVLVYIYIYIYICIYIYKERDSLYKDIFILSLKLYTSE